MKDVARESRWPTVRIGDVCNLMTGGTPSRGKPEYFDGNIRWLVSGDIHRKEILDCEGRISALGVQNSNARMLPLNSVMIALNGQGKTRGTVAMLRTEATCNQSLVSIAPKETSQLLSEFVFMNLHGRYEEIRRMTGDAGNERRGLNMRLIKGIEIPLPPLNQQKRIVEVLDEAFAALDRARANAEANLQNARELFEQSASEIFDRLTAGGNETTLGAIAEFRNGLNYSRTSSGQRVNVVGVRDFLNRFWVETSALKAVNIDGNLQEDDLLRACDLLAVRSNGNKELIGRVMLMPDTDVDASFSGFTIRIRLTDNDVSPEFLCHHLKTEEVRKLLTSSGGGANISNLNQKTLSSLALTVPGPERQSDYVDAMNALGEQVEQLEVSCRNRLNSIAELRQSLLQEAFAGELT